MASDPTTNSHDDLVDALQLAAAALQCVAPLLPDGERRVVKFTGEWSHLGSLSIGAILNAANTALAPYSKELT